MYYLVNSLVESLYSLGKNWIFVGFLAVNGFFGSLHSWCFENHEKTSKRLPENHQ